MGQRDVQTKQACPLHASEPVRPQGPGSDPRCSVQAHQSVPFLGPLCVQAPMCKYPVFMALVLLESRGRGSLAPCPQAATGRKSPISPW